MRIPSQAEIDARAVELGQAENGKCPRHLRAAIAKQLMDQTTLAAAPEPQSLTAIVAEFDKNLSAADVSELVRAHAIGALVASLTAGNTEITTT